MADALAAFLIDALLGLKVGASGQDISNRFSVDGLTLRSKVEGALAIGIRRFEADSLRLESGSFMLEVGRLALNQLVGQVLVDQGRPRLGSLEVADAELSDVKVHGPLILSPKPQRDLHASHVHGSPPLSADTGPAQNVAGAWDLGPLAAADGTIRAEIVDAHLLFDADVTVPIRQGQIDFNEATVEHMGPDSRMGVSRLGLYVDAPNGRSYLYQFPAAPITGVEFERRGALPGPWGTNRGNLRLQSFLEGVLRQGRGGPGGGFTDQAREMFERTALSGDVQLSDGRFAAPGVEAHLAGRADRRNAIRVSSEAVGRGLAVALDSLSVRNAVLNARDTRMACDEIAGALDLRVLVEGAQLRFAFDVSKMKMSRLRLHSQVT